MGLKRKRSLQLSSDPVESSTSWATASQRDSSSRNPIGRNSPYPALEPSVEVGWGIDSNFVEITPRHLDSRTKKRFRDARPSPQQVFERTLQLLRNSAQAQKPEYHSRLSSPPVSPKSPQCSSLPRKFLTSVPPQSSLSNNYPQEPPAPQPTLHSFWPLLSRAHTPVSTLPTPPPPSQYCEDCDSPLRSSMDVDGNAMDIDGFEQGGFSCHGCGRSVCDRCAVLGERTCLECATR